MNRSKKFRTVFFGGNPNRAKIFRQLDTPPNIRICARQKVPTKFFIIGHTLFRKKRFEINFFVQKNASKFAIFIEKENPRSFFRFSFRATLSFTL